MYKDQRAAALPHEQTGNAGFQQHGGGDEECVFARLTKDFLEVCRLKSWIETTFPGGNKADGVRFTQPIGEDESPFFVPAEDVGDTDVASVGIDTDRGGGVKLIRHLRKLRRVSL